MKENRTIPQTALHVECTNTAAFFLPTMSPQSQQVLVCHKRILWRDYENHMSLVFLLPFPDL